MQRSWVRIPLSAQRKNRGERKLSSMNNDEDGDTLSVSQEEQVQKFIAQMNVFSQHQKVMAEFTKPKKKVKEKNKK
jgi:hypothetical protein